MEIATFVQCVCLQSQPDRAGAGGGVGGRVLWRPGLVPEMSEQPTRPLMRPQKCRIISSNCSK